jgi:hypothetical protein
MRTCLGVKVCLRAGPTASPGGVRWSTWPIAIPPPAEQHVACAPIALDGRAKRPSRGSGERQAFVRTQVQSRNEHELWMASLSPSCSTSSRRSRTFVTFFISNSSCGRSCPAAAWQLQRLPIRFSNRRRAAVGTGSIAGVPERVPHGGVDIGGARSIAEWWQYRRRLGDQSETDSPLRPGRGRYCSLRPCGLGLAFCVPCANHDET